MKRTLFSYIFLMAACLMVSAQEKMIQIVPENREVAEELKSMATPRMIVAPDRDVKDEPVAIVENVVVEGVTPVFKGNAVRKAPAEGVCTDPNCTCDACTGNTGGGSTGEKAGYTNPIGTLFLGITEDGKETWLSRGGIVGAANHKLDCWVWPNTTTGAYRKMEYNTYFSTNNPNIVEDGYYGIDANGNFMDSIIAAGGLQLAYAMGADGDLGYSWQLATPQQLVTRQDGRKDTFMLLGSAESTRNCPFAAGGLPSSVSSDGLWPLTNAVGLKDGKVQKAISYKNSQNKACYFFGTTAIEKGDGTSVKPQSIITHYDAPQGGFLYVKSVTVACGDKRTIKGDLHLDVLDHEGNVIASSNGSIANGKQMSGNFAGRLLTFTFDSVSAYGELLKDGFTVTKEFSLKISGFDVAASDFGIYAAPSSVHRSKSEIVCVDGSVVTYNYDPFIMLNGIYTNLEDYRVINYDYDTKAHGDTVDIAFHSNPTVNYKYSASYAASDYKGDMEFSYYSTFVPYDSVSHYWTMDIERPSYVVMTADYQYNLGEDDDPITLWDYYRLFTMHIYATEKPVLGDIIKFGKWGKYVVMRVARVDNEELAEDGSIHKREEAPARKMMQDGQLLISRGDATYNALGVRVD